MKKLTRKAHAFIDNVVGEIVGNSGIEGAGLCEDGDNPFSYIIAIPIDTDERLVLRTGNELFHALGLLPQGKNLSLGEFGDYCRIVRGGSSDGECYVLVFNHPAVLEFNDDDPECRFILKNWDSADEDEEAEEAEVDHE